MSSRCLERCRLVLTGATALVAVVAAVVLPFASQADEVADEGPPLRVCVDPDRMPYSQHDQVPHDRVAPAGEQHDGDRSFEVRVAQIVAAQLQRPLELHWQPMIRGTVRKTLKAGECDVLAGVPVGYDPVLTTRPYYRSSYVIVSRRDDPQPLGSFNDPRLSTLRIGVELIGNDLAASPPGHVLAQRGATQHVVGFSLFNDPRPIGARMVDAVARNELDAALLWGPQAGWFARQAPVIMRVVRAPAGVTMPFEFGIAMGVRKSDRALRDALQAALDAKRAEIDAVLAEYGVPRTDIQRSALAQEER